MRLIAANRDLNLAVNAALKRNAISFGADEYQRFYLPVAEGGVNRVERPTLITVIRDISLGGANTDMSSVNGVSVMPRDWITAWIDDEGNKWYAKGGGAGDVDGELFATIEDAAKAGYWPYDDAYR
ncbi:hypothetical protein FACS1894202_08240 [Clostridia bacterium]|nr:hypothetical protein FACS1894202_08240 [Clostridia bacterium]